MKKFHPSFKNLSLRSFSSFLFFSATLASSLHHWLLFVNSTSILDFSAFTNLLFASSLKKISSSSVIGSIIFFKKQAHLMRCAFFLQQPMKLLLFTVTHFGTLSTTRKSTLLVQSVEFAESTPKRRPGHNNCIGFRIRCIKELYIGRIGEERNRKIK